MGGFRVKNGGTLLFNESAAFANTFSGGVVVELGGSLRAKQSGTTGTPFGSGPIEIQCTGEKLCYVQFVRFDIPQTVTTTGNSTAEYPAFRTTYAGTTLHGVVVGGNLYMDAQYADAKDSSMANVVFDFTEGRILEKAAQNCSTNNFKPIFCLKSSADFAIVRAEKEK